MTEDEAKKGNLFDVLEWENYIGQEKIKERLQIKIQAAMARFEQMDHALILGQSGTGKTTIARLIAKEHNASFLDIMITPSFTPKTLAKMLIQFEEEEDGGIVLLDELHNFTKKDQHYLYSILLDNCISYDSGKRHYFTKPITIIAATTDEKDLTPALRGRFGAPYRLRDYTDKEMGQIVERMAYKAGLDPTIETCVALGRASAGSPRQAADLIKTARDLGSMDPGPILELSEITKDGLTVDHIAILESLRNLGNIAGLENISNHSGRAREDIVTLEKLLVKKGLIDMGGKGRELTIKGMKALNEAVGKK